MKIGIMGARRDMQLDVIRHLLGRVLTTFLLLFLLLGVFNESDACPLDKTKKTENEQCIAVNGTELYVKTFGLSSPNVVFISGYGVDTHYWDNVTLPVSNFAHVIVYDRPGVGQSPVCTECNALAAKDNIVMLRTLLHKKNIQPPYILVGHSLGGLYAQYFAESYPSEVRGVVLVDSSARNETITLETLPTSPTYKEAIGFKASEEQVKHAGPFPPVPLIILTATHHAKKINEAAWQRWQKDMLDLSPHAIQFIAWGSDHNMQRDQPQLIVDAIYTLTNAINNQ